MSAHAFLFSGGFMKDLFTDKPGVWNELKTSEKPVVLYGMGDGADKVLAAFERFGIRAEAVMASDGFVRGQSFHGFVVKKLSDLEAEYGDFTVVLCFASQLPDVIDTIKNVAVRHRLIVPSVPAFGDKIFDNEFIAENADNMNRAYELLEDDLSRRVFENALLFYRTGDIALLDPITTDKDEAFENILKLGKNEVYLDLGAYNGDTVEEFLRYTGGRYKKITALEPNAKNYKKLYENCSALENAELLRLGAWSEKSTLIFNNKAGRNSAVAEKGVETQVDAVDNILGGGNVTYIKADVEGADHETLLGMKNTLKTRKPKLNFAAYHRFEDIFRLPMLVYEMNPEYKIYLRHHPYIPAWDTNLYCV